MWCEGVLGQLLVLLKLTLCSQQSHSSTGDVLVCAIGLNSYLGGTSCCITHHYSSRFAGPGRTHRSLGTLLCYHRLLVSSWRDQGSQRKLAACSHTESPKLRSARQTLFINIQTLELVGSKSIRTKTPKAIHHHFDEDHFCKHYQCLSPSPLKGKHS